MTIGLDGVAIGVQRFDVVLQLLVGVAQSGHRFRRCPQDLCGVRRRWWRLDCPFCGHALGSLLWRRCRRFDPPLSVRSPPLSGELGATLRSPGRLLSDWTNALRIRYSSDLAKDFRSGKPLTLDNARRPAV